MITTGMVMPRISLVRSLNCDDELPDVDAVLAQRGANRRSRRRLAAGTLQLDLCRNLLRHDAVAVLVGRQ